MKFIEISKAKIEFNAPVFTKNKNGEFGLGKLKKKEETDNGMEWTFHMASFSYDNTEADFSTEIVLIAKPK